MHKKRLKITLLCFLLIGVMLLTGCGGGKSSTPGDSSAEGSGAKREDLNFAFLSECKELDPHKATDTITYTILLQIFDTLIKIEPDGTLALPLQRTGSSRMTAQKYFYH